MDKSLLNNINSVMQSDHRERQSDASGSIDRCLVINDALFFASASGK